LEGKKGPAQGEKSSLKKKAGEAIGRGEEEDATLREDTTPSEGEIFW